MLREVDALEPVPAERLYSPRQLSAEGLMCFRRLVARDHGAQLGHHHTRLGVRVERSTRLSTKGSSPSPGTVPCW